ncbi:MAG: 2'-5' RNA ligase family protein [Actinoplanes sp.]
MPEIDLARREGVELVRTGSWSTMSGSWNPTPDDLAAAVEAQSCPAIGKPIIKLGHLDKRFKPDPENDGEPAMGYFENLRVADGGHTLLGDQVTLPWLHSVQAAAYPSRSIEGNYNHTCASGHRHKFVLTAVALLGVTPPAVKTIRRLNDLPAMLGVAASEPEVPEGAEHVQVTIMAGRHSFDESKHKRDDDGQFASKSGGGSHRADTGSDAPAQPARTVKLRESGGDQLTLQFADGGMTFQFPHDNDDEDEQFDTVTLDRKTTAEFAEELDAVSTARDAYVKRAKQASDRFDKAEAEGDTSSPEYLAAQEAWFELGGDGQSIIRGELDTDNGALVYEMRMGADVADTELFIAVRPQDAGEDWDLQDTAENGAGGVLSQAQFRRLRKEVGGAVQVAASEPTVAAAAEVHTGAMIALIPTADDAARLAVDGGEPADQLHVTLRYLGEAEALGITGRQDVLDGVTRAANGLPQFEADAFALSVFNPGRPDRDTCIVLGLSGDPIDAVHDLINEALSEALWAQALTLPAPHRPFHCHLTLEYTEDLTNLAALTDRIGPITFDRIRVAFGGDIVDIPLIPPSEDETVAASAVIRKRSRQIRRRLVRLEKVQAAGRRFDESRVNRDGDGQFADKAGVGGSGDAAPARKSRDKLKLAGSLPLGNGETLVSSAKVSGNSDSARDTQFAVVDGPDGITLRVALGGDEGDPFDGAAALNEDGIGELWDRIGGMDAVIKQRTAAYGQALSDHKARVDKMFADANDWYASLPADKIRSRESVNRLKDLEDAAFAADSKGRPDPEWEGDLHVIDGPDGSAVAFQLRSVEGDSNLTDPMNKPYAGIDWVLDVAVRPSGAPTGWSLDTDVGDDATSAWSARQVREFPKLLDRLTVGDDERDSIKASLLARHDRVLASASPLRHLILAADFPVLPAAEPELVIQHEEDPVSLSDDMRSWGGRAAPADEVAAHAANDELKARAEKTPEMVAASAAVAEKAEQAEAENTRLNEKVQILDDLVKKQGEELASIRAEKAAAAKDSVLASARQQGKFKPADFKTWEARYDKAPEVTTEILASIPVGAEVPVMASGTTGPAEPEGTDPIDAEYERLFGEKAGA